MDHQERPRDKISAHREFKVVKITHFSSFKSRILSFFFAVCEEKNPEELRILLQVFRAEVFDVFHFKKWNCYIQNDVTGRSRPGSWSVLGMAGTVCITCLFGACCHPQSFYSNTRTRRLFLILILWHTVYAQNYCQFLIQALLGELFERYNA